MSQANRTRPDRATLRLPLPRPGQLALLALLLPLSTSAGAPPGARDAGPSALDATDPQQLLAALDASAEQLKDHPKSFEVLAALGGLYYENARYLDAIDALRLALQKAAPVEAHADALRARGLKPAAQLPPACHRSGTVVGLEQIAATARKLEASSPAAALRCDEEALAPALQARARRGDALYLIGQPEAALAEHRHILARAPDSPESLFFLGAITLEQSRGDQAMLEEGKRAWRRLLEVAPDHPRAALVRESLPKADEMFGAKPTPGQSAPISGASAQPASTPGPAEPSTEQMRSVADAVSQTERTPELEQGLDALTAQAERDLDAGRFQQARDAMVRVMPMRSADARTAADLGAAMAGLGKLEMAERVLSKALQDDPKQPRALVALGKLLLARGDKAGGRAKLLAAQAADKAFADAHGVRELLAQP